MSFMISHNGEVSDSMSENRSSGLALQVAQMELVQLIGMVRSSPRDETVCSASLRADVLRNVESAEECSYTRRIGRGDDQNNVTGPTVRFAEAVQRAWGRARISTEVIDIDDRFVVAEGRFLDLQTLTSVSRQVRRSIVKRDGNTYGPEMIATASNAACSIALRNIVLYGGVPSSFWQPVYEDARHLVRKHVSGDLASKCRSVLEVFSRDYGVKSETVLSYLDLTSIDAMRVSDVVDLRGLYIAIRDSEVDAASVFEGFGSVSAKPTTNKKAQVRTPPKAEQVTSNVPQVPKQESVTVPDTAKIQ